MPADSQRKRCIACKKVYGGTRGKAQWCDRCGGEMRPIIYSQLRRRLKT